MRQNEKKKCLLQFSATVFCICSWQLNCIRCGCYLSLWSGDTMQFFFPQVGAIFQIHINYSYYTGVWKSWSLAVVNFQSFEMQFSHLSRSSSLKYRSHPFFTVMCSGNWYIFLLSLNKYPLHETWLGFKPLFCLKAHFNFFSPMINKCWVKSIAFFFILTCFIQSKSMWKFKLLLLNDPYTSSSLWCWPVEGATAKCVAEWATSRWTHHDFHDDGGTSSTNSFWTVWTLLSNDGGIIYERTALGFQDSCV